MKQYLKYFAPAVLIAFGSTLEIYYYWFRFVGDGVDHIFAFIAGAVLTVFLIVVSRYKNFGARSLAGVLIAYSVFCTSAGQAYSLEQVRLKMGVEAMRQADSERERERLENTIQRLTERWESIEEQKTSQIQSFDDRFAWRNTLAQAEQNQKEIQAEIDVYRGQLNALLNSGQILPPDIYQYYGRIMSVSPIVLQVILQMLLSAFIALMAPVGVAIWPVVKKTEEIPEIKPARKRREQRPEPEPHEPPKQTEALPDRKAIDRWVQISWWPLTMGKGTKIVRPDEFRKFIESRHEDFNLAQYQQYLDAAIKSGAIQKDGEIIDPDTQSASDRIYKFLCL